MNIDQTKCDNCGKIHATPNRTWRSPGKQDLISVPLTVKGKTEYLDFCDENCLREQLIKRHEPKAA